MELNALLHSSSSDLSLLKEELSRVNGELLPLKEKLAACQAELATKTCQAMDDESLETRLASDLREATEYSKFCEKTLMENQHITEELMKRAESAEWELRRHAAWS